jgi:ketosteroid isomerase-like protein
MKTINTFFAGIICMFLFSSCSQDGINKEGIQIIEKYIRAVESKDVEAMAALLHEDYKGYGPSVTDSTNRQQAIENWKYLSSEYYDEIKYEDVENLTHSVKEGPRKGDWISNWALLSLSYKDGRGPVKLYVNAVYRIEDGKIIHSRTFYNEADVLRQLGYSFN